jgi:V/A-type H+/Na+-transporting ATPase subunit A
MIEQTHSKGKVSGIIANLVLVQVDGPFMQNEICYIIRNETHLMAEVIKAVDNTAYVQVFENTNGIRCGTEVIFSGHMLQATLGPGILSCNYDGLLHNLATMTGIFIQPGDYTDTIDMEKQWYFTPTAAKGTRVKAGDWIGEVQENNLSHKIMVPFNLEGHYSIEKISPEGNYLVSDIIAILINEKGKEFSIKMAQKWPVKKAIGCFTEKPRPFKMMETGIRTIDIMSPMLMGGTGFIPGPFGSGKTVLQQSIARQAEADVVIIAACGERANEIVETFTEFPKLDDPWTGKKLMERTVIIANTSNMPVAAREASVYSAMTIAEYYRAMGHKVLLLADSTSRWAQALREMSNRMEELPGPDAFPMDLSAIVSNFYARAGFVKLNNGTSGSVTFIGTVSPAGGNLKEPVTESTKKAARCFYALSQTRADSKRYPALDPVESYSKYLEYEEFKHNIQDSLGSDWADKVTQLKNYLRKGIEASDQISILGDDGVALDTHLQFWHSEVIDNVILQQDAFDSIDGRTPIERQKFMVNHILNTLQDNIQIESYEEVRPFYKKMINIYKQMNYLDFQCDAFNSFQKELETMILDTISPNPQNIAQVI